MDIIALVLAIIMTLGGWDDEYSHNSRVLIGYYEDSALPLSDDNPCHNELLDLLAAMEGVQETERFSGSKIPSGYVLCGGDRIEYGAYVEMGKIPEVEGYEPEPMKRSLYIYHSRANDLCLYDWEYYLELDTLSNKARHDELIGKIFTAEVIQTDAKSGLWHTVVSDKYGTLSVTLAEPLFAEVGDILELTVVENGEEFTRLTPLLAKAEIAS